MGFKRGKDNFKYIDGRTLKKYFCIDCGRKLSDYRNKRCPSCENKKRFIGKKLSESHKNKISEALKKAKPKKKYYCIDCGKELSNCKAIRCKKCEGIRRRIPKKSYFCKEPNCNNEISMSSALYGEGRCRSCANKNERNPAWKDGLTPLRNMIRQMEKYKEWRMNCLKRDYFRCQECFSKEKLEVHHTKLFQELLDEFLREYDQFSPIEDKETLVRLAIKWKSFWNIDNGKTLCKKCHLIIEPRNIKVEV